MGRWREWINNNSATVTIGAVVVLVVALGIVYCQRRGPSETEVVRKAYFYDLDKGELLVLPSDEVPPVKTRTGGQAVLAHVYSCGECTKEEMFVGYLERFPDEVREEVKQARSHQPRPAGSRSLEDLDETKLYATEEDAKDPAKWLPLGKPETLKIFGYPKARCDKEAKEKGEPRNARPCLPE